MGNSSSSLLTRSTWNNINLAGNSRAAPGLHCHQGHNHNYATHQARTGSARQYYTVPPSSHERRAHPNIAEPPRFHSQAKGKNIRLDSHFRKATRKNSFCNGVTFSNRPVHLYEKVRLRLSVVLHGWSGALRFGFTSHDPSLMGSADIPKYACPDLVTRPGYWAKALPERFALKDNVLAFWVDRHGRVFYNVNDEDPILFQCGINASGPLWALIDIYGITQEVQMLESMFAETITSARLNTARLSSCLPQTSHDNANFNNNELENSVVVAKITNLNLGTSQSSPVDVSPSGSPGGSHYDSDSDMAFSVNRSSSASESSLVTAPSSPLSPQFSPSFSPPEPPNSKNGECTVCFDSEVDTVIYTCGHMCLCYSCGLKLKKQINACCPICRRVIKDVIKIYRP
ncbi:E3 ubiquitin-protein ligase NEURL1B isoform X3 [Heptranchias perlo]|uniref:E3 ubiquitin-protein ligase NEURL1B isoform X3 n=1 Tax=Heptranchias perlo TaxID=212740 RepID=UPI00355A4988